MSAESRGETESQGETNARGESERPTRLMFVCSGNICRSPSAEGVMRHMLAAAGMDHVAVASSGTGGWHIGQAPDGRAQAVARQRGYDLSAQRAQQLTDADFRDYHRLFAMDLGHLRHMRARVPGDLRHRVRLFLDPLDPEALQGPEVPDPYYEDEAVYERALDLVEEGARTILDALKAGRL
jgi:protein-tyrosine phosphatase